MIFLNKLKPSWTSFASRQTQKLSKNSNPVTSFLFNSFTNFSVWKWRSKHTRRIKYNKSSKRKYKKHVQVALGLNYLLFRLLNIYTSLWFFIHCCCCCCVHSKQFFFLFLLFNLLFFWFSHSAILCLLPY